MHRFDSKMAAGDNVASGVEPALLVTLLVQLEPVKMIRGRREGFYKGVFEDTHTVDGGNLAPP